MSHIGGFQALPTELILEVATYVTYREAIMISQSCKRFLDMIDPRTWPTVEKSTFIHDAPMRKYLLKHQEPGASVL